jgi:hypothetical protein
MSFLSLLDTTCTIYATSYTTSSIGERVKQVTAIDSAVPCRINRVNANEMIFAENDSVRIDSKIYMDYRTDFEEWDYILVENLRYKVSSVYVVSDSSGPHHLEIDAYKDKQI